MARSGPAVIMEKIGSAAVPSGLRSHALGLNQRKYEGISGVEQPAKAA